MKLTKKLFAVAIALCMMLCLSVTAFAEDGGKTYTDTETVTIKKVYKLTNDKTISPSETFNLTEVSSRVVDGEATEVPKLVKIEGATFTAGEATIEGATENITITLPQYAKVGVYEYTLREVDGKTAGVAYYGDDIKLKVTVINDEKGNLRIAGVHTENETNNKVEDGKDKKDSFPNTYSAGDLSISKTVDGNLGDKDMYFDFEVTLTGEDGKNYGESYVVSGGSDGSGNVSSVKVGETAELKLKHGDTVTIKNLPYGVTYTVTETAVDKYETEKTGDTGTINAATQTAKFTNTKNGNIDAGVMLDSLPYVLVLMAVLGGAVVMFTRKRRYED